MKDLLRQAQFATHRSHLILEEELERLDQLQTHISRQAAYVVMRLDPVRTGPSGAGALDDIRVDGALGQELEIAQPPCLALKDAHELGANDPPLFLRVRDALSAPTTSSAASMPTRCILASVRKVRMTCSASPGAAGRDRQRHTQLVAHRMVDKGGSDCRINPS